MGMFMKDEDARAKDCINDSFGQGSNCETCVFFKDETCKCENDYCSHWSIFSEDNTYDP